MNLESIAGLAIFVVAVLWWPIAHFFGRSRVARALKRKLDEHRDNDWEG